MVDVVSRRCEEAECRRRPLYGHEGEKGRFCSYHKVSQSLIPEKLQRNQSCSTGNWKTCDIIYFEALRYKEYV